MTSEHDIPIGTISPSPPPRQQPPAAPLSSPKAKPRLFSVENMHSTENSGRGRLFSRASSPRSSAPSPPTKISRHGPTRTVHDAPSTTTYTRTVQAQHPHRLLTILWTEPIASATEYSFGAPLQFQFHACVSQALLQYAVYIRIFLIRSGQIFPP